MKNIQASTKVCNYKCDYCRIIRVELSIGSVRREVWQS